MFPHPRRIVTGHNNKGEAIFLKDSEVPALPTPSGANFAVLWESSQFPASNDGDEDPIDVETKDLANKNGFVFRVVDIPANNSRGMLFHRTESLDFGILMEGEVSCYLDNNEKVDMKPGDVCVQRGTIHGWVNSSDKPCRLYFILIAAKPVTVNGETLGNQGYQAKDMVSGGKL